MSNLIHVTWKFLPAFLNLPPPRVDCLTAILGSPEISDVIPLVINFPVGDWFHGKNVQKRRIFFPIFDFVIFFSGVVGEIKDEKKKSKKSRWVWIE